MNRLAVEFEILRHHVAQAGANIAFGFISASRSFAAWRQPARLGVLIVLALLINAVAPVPDDSNRDSASLLPLKPGTTRASAPPQNGGGNGTAGKIAFVSSRNKGNPDWEDIFIMNADGSSQTRIVDLSWGDGNGPNFGAQLYLDWSPDGTKLAFSAGDDVSEVFVVNADGTNLLQLTDAQPPSTHPTWSPDGTQIAFSRMGAVWVMNADGSNQHVLVDQGTGINSTVDPDWSPDGTKIVFSGFVFDSAVNTHRREVFTVDSAGATAPVQLTSSPYPRFSLDPAWSPDGQKIVFVRREGFSINQDNIWIMNANGSNQHVVASTPISDQTPTFSPDGQKILFVSFVPQPPDPTPFRKQIFVANVNGGPAVSLTGNNSWDDYAPASSSLPQSAGNTPVGTNVSVQSGNLTVTFDNVTTAGNTTVSPIDPSSLPPLPSQYTLFAGNETFDISTTAGYTGNITVRIDLSPAVTDPAVFAALRILHGEGNPLSMVDRTILSPFAPAPDFAAQTIHARVTTLSPFALAIFTPEPPPSGTPFASFDVRAQIDLEPQANDDRFAIESLLTLGSTSNGINPLAEAVSIQLGTGRWTIPAGSFRRNALGGFTFTGLVGTTRLGVAVQRLYGRTYAFVAAGDRSDLTGTTNPVTVRVEIGDDAGSRSTRAEIR